MKCSDWLRARSMQEVLMVIATVLLLVMIATRWHYIRTTTSEAFRRRFVPPTEAASPTLLPADSLRNDTLPHLPAQ